jgi:hypothetical protein
MYHQFNTQQMYALPTLYVFCIYLRTNSDLCHLQHKLIGFYKRDCVYCAVRTVSLTKAVLCHLHHKLIGFYNRDCVLRERGCVCKASSLVSHAQKTDWSL